MDNVVRAHALPDPLVARPVEGVSDLAHLHQDVRAVLAGVQEHTITGAALVVVMLCADALRYGAPPVTLRLTRSPDDRRLRVEVDHRSAGAAPMIEESRATLFDRMTTIHGIERGPATTMRWAEVSLVPGGWARRDIPDPAGL